MKDKKPKPLQILFRGESIKTVEELQIKSGAKSKAEVIRDAIALYEILSEISKKGEIIIRARDSEKEQLITMPHKNVTIENEDTK